MKAYAFIQNEELLTFVSELVENYGSEEKTLLSDKVTDNLELILTNKKLLIANAQQLYIEVLFATAAVFNLFYDGTIPSLFQFREITKDSKIDNQILDSMAQTIEAQLGDNTPVPILKPNTNSPSELFSLAVFIAKNFDRI